MEKQKQRPAPSEGGNHYLHTQKTRWWLVLLAALILLSGALCWMFFGSCNITVTGYAQVVKDLGTYCIIPSTDIGRVEPGMKVWVDNLGGTLTRLGDTYHTYEQMTDLYGYSAQHLRLREDETYYIADADIVEKESGYSRFTVVTGTVTPFEYFFGGADQ